MYEVYEIARGDLMHLGGYAPGWYFDIPDGLRKGPYRTKAIARRVCTRWINDYERALRRLRSIGSLTSAKKKYLGR
jgi:hypothetical protein